VVRKGTPLPSRIEPDAIVEALFEIRFDMVSPLLEVLLGRLTAVPHWADYKQRTLDAYNVPAGFRDSDPNFRFMPVFELASTNPARAIRFGNHVISLHEPAPYTGWDRFVAELNVMTDAIFANTGGLVINRLGLRYINALSPNHHGIAGVPDMDIAITVSEAPLNGRLALSFFSSAFEQTDCKVAITTTEFVQGQLPPDTAVYVDVDVASSPGFTTSSPHEVRAWLEKAHGAKNDAFLDLLTRPSLDRLGRT
jgi:uncharacterized protein (TIGR04255 family)